jgi:hypothetical protein
MIHDILVQVKYLHNLVVLLQQHTLLNEQQNLEGIDLRLVLLIQ